MPGPRSNWIRHVFIGHFSPRRASLVTSVTGEEFGLTLSDPFSIFQAPQIRSGHDRTFSQLEVGMKNRLLTFALLLFLAPFTSQSQIPRTISYQGVLQKDGSPFSGDALFTFTLYRGTSAAWISPPVPARVTNGVFNTTLGPFPDALNFNGIDSLGISYNGTQLSPRIAITAVAFSLVSAHATFADSAANPGPAGAKGDKGDTGLAGTAGSKGDKGDKGDTGPAGAAGAKGDKGDPGERGEAGLPGAKGDKGDTGQTGAAGAKGDKGDPGERGEAGLPGAKGDKGEKGDKGDHNSLSSTDAANNTLVFLLSSASGQSIDYAKLVRTGNASTFRLEIAGSSIPSGNYSASWDSASGVATGYGSFSFGTAKEFSLGSAYHFSIMMIVNDGWAKVDLFRVNTTDDKWYGFSVTN